MPKIVDWIKKHLPFFQSYTTKGDEPYFWPSSPTPGISHRERRIRDARTKIPDSLLLAFMRAIPAEGSLIFVQILQESLDHQPNLDEIFGYGDGDEFGYNLTVVSNGEYFFTIELGYLAGELMGDGGEWEVTFDTHGHVSEISGGATWIS